MFDFYVNLGWRTQYCGIERLMLDDVCIYLVDSEFYFGDKIYRGGQAEGEQYAFFTRAVLDAIPNLGFMPDIVHCNDWHTAMLPMLAKTQYGGAIQGSLRWLLTIHNIAYQGKPKPRWSSSLHNLFPLNLPVWYLAGSAGSVYGLNTLVSMPFMIPESSLERAESMPSSPSPK